MLLVTLFMIARKWKQPSAHPLKNGLRNRYGMRANTVNLEASR